MMCYDFVMIDLFFRKKCGLKQIYRFSVLGVRMFFGLSLRRGVLRAATRGKYQRHFEPATNRKFF